MLLNHQLNYLFKKIKKKKIKKQIKIDDEMDFNKIKIKIKLKLNNYYLNYINYNEKLVKFKSFPRFSPIYYAPFLLIKL